MGSSTLALSAATVSGLAARVREANEARRPVRVVGAGTWRNAAPVDATVEISTTALDEILEYVPGDLTITVGAGTKLSAIERATAEHGQWLTLDPHGSHDGTIGATVASASAGPLATGFGTPRDLVLGIEAVSGTGSVIRAGGRVVKNVAGFDLARLFTGSRGTIGAITEISLRLRGRPTMDETLAVELPAKPNAIRDAVSAMRAWTTRPMCAELLDARTAKSLGLMTAPTVILRIGGNARSITAQKKRITALGRVTTADALLWQKLRALDLEHDIAFRVSDLPTAFMDRWDQCHALASGRGLSIGSPLRGQVRCLLPAIDRGEMGAFRSAAPTATLVYDALPSAAAWNAMTSIPDETTLNARVRAAFDPAGIMNPGAMRLAR